MKVIGITGGVGAGKSTVLEYLQKKWDVYVIQADKVGHLVIEPGERCYEKVIGLFGERVVKSDKTIDRKAVSDVVFSNEEMLSRLNGLIHPAVKSYILQKIEEQRQNGREIFIVEAALLFEDHYEEFCDEVWYIHTDREIRIARLMENRGYTREKSESIIKNQAPDTFFFDRADYVIENNDDLEKTFRQIEKGVENV